MPIIKSAIKKMRQDRKRAVVNQAKRELVKKAVKNLVKAPSAESLSKAFSALDRAAKKGLIPKGRVNRKKARLTASLGRKTPIAVKKTANKKTSKKTSSK